MPWQGSWRWVYSGKYTASDETVFEGIWTPPANQDPLDGPPPSPNPVGLPSNNDVPHQGPWQGSYDAYEVWRGTYTATDGTVFEGTMMKAQA